MAASVTAGSHRRACADDEQERIRGTKQGAFQQIMNAMHGPRCGGLFVEAGANTGINSVTGAFERIGWHGLCVEASPYLFNDFLTKNRPGCENVHAALVDGPDSVVFRAYTQRLGDLSGIESFRTRKQWAKMEREHANDRNPWKLSRTNVTALSPAKLLAGRDHVDLFSLDVEGAEMNVLKSFPFDDVRVDFWFVETNKLDREAFMGFMSQRHYHCHHVDHVNTLCRHKEVRASRRRR
jgi:FkbM family methyltransferase